MSAPLVSRSRREVTDWMIQAVARATGQKPEAIDTGEPFSLMGLSSLDAVQIISELNAWAGADLSATLFFEHPDIRSFANHVTSVGVARATTPTRTFSSEPVAVIGVACRLPSAESTDEFWRLLAEGRSGIGPVPRSRWTPKPGTPDWGGFLADVEAFDASLFEVFKGEAERMDPQQRLLMQASWSALEDAGYAPRGLGGSETGVFVGVSSFDYSLLRKGLGTDADIYDGTGNAHSIAANRISYFYNFNGPSWAVDTACSSSLVALHHAASSLRSGEATLALAGGVNLLLTSELTEAFCKAGMLSPDGRCKTFSAGANGYVRGEGVVMFVLKRLSDAERDGDRIYGVIRGSATNQDGRTNGLTAPNGVAQELAIRNALAFAGLTVDDIDYIEAHGTGTSLGDPIEYHAIKRVFADRTHPTPIRLGSVKTNIGHLEAAAGAAGVLKVLLALNRETIPKQLHFTGLNPEIRADQRLLEIADRESPWPRGDRPRIAGVSSFGFGGTNVHLILSEAPPPRRPTLRPYRLPSPPSHVLRISASTEDSLKATAKSYVTFLRGLTGAEALARTCLAAATQRSPLAARLAVTGASVEEVAERLSAHLDGRSAAGLFHGAVQRKRQRKIAFMFTGQGSQSPGMGLELYKYQPVFREAMNRCLDLLQPHFERSLTDVLWSAEPEISAEMYQTDFGQALLWALEVSLAELWKAMGLEPDFVCGHSLGEISAATVAGALSLEDAARLVAERGQRMRSTVPGAMSVVYEAAEVLMAALPRFEGQLNLAAINGPKLCVLSGTEGAVTAFEEWAAGRGVTTKRLPVKQGFHSHLMDPVLDGFERAIAATRFSEPRVPLISCRNGQFLTAKELTPAYWREHLREPTDFFAAVKTLAGQGVEVAVEIGPHPTLVPMAQGAWPGTQPLWIASLNRKQGEFQSVTESAARLFVHGIDLNTALLEPSVELARELLPKTEFAKMRYWLEPLAGPAEEKLMTMKRKKSVAEILSEITTLVAQQLELAPGDIDPRQPLIDMGADSLVLLNSLELIKERLGVQVSVADVFRELTDLEKIAAYIHEQLPEETVPATAPPTISTFAAIASPPAAEPSPLVATLGSAPLATVSPSSVLEQLLHNQLQIMAQQLELLRGQPLATPAGGESRPTPSSPTPIPRPPAPNPAPGATTAESGASGRGVLGNFRSRALTSDEVLEDQRKEAYLKRLIEEFNRRTPKTKEHTQKYRAVLSDNRVSAGFRPRLKEMVYPIVFSRAKGARFTDMDGNDYVDFTMGFGVNLFGHNPDFIQRALERQLAEGLAVGPQSAMAGPVAEAFCELTGHERVAFVNSGTEAIMTAVRLARAATKRQKVVLFEGSYHGHYDGVLGRRNAAGQTVAVAPGVPTSLVNDLIVLEYGSPEALTYIRSEASNLAAVLIEPVQSRFPENQPGDFLKEIRAITQASGTAFIWDEVITGFRVSPGGAQAHFGIKGDLATYGKILGGGLPIGAVGGEARFMNFIDGGQWSFGDASMPTSEMTFFAGTFCKHPLAMAAGFEVLRKIRSEGAAVLDDLNRRTHAMAEELNRYFADRRLEMRIVHFGSLFRFKFGGNADWLFFALNNRGFYIWEGRNLFLSTAHTEADVSAFVRAVQEVCDELIAIGYLKGQLTDSPATPKPRAETAPRSNFVAETLPLIEPQRRFAQLSLAGPMGDAASHVCLALELEGPLNESLMREAVERVFARHDALSAAYDPVAGTVSFRDAQSLRLMTLDLSTLNDPDKALSGWMIENAGQDFDLAERPLRLHLIKLSPSRHVISLAAHHLALDGLSAAILAEEIAKTYSATLKGQNVKLSKARSFREYMKEYTARAGGPKEAHEFWSQTLAGFSQRLPWEASLGADLSGRRLTAFLEPEAFKALRQFSFKNSATLLMTLMAPFLQQLRRNWDLPEFIVGVPVAGHSSISESMVGNCVNLVPLRMSAPEDMAPAQMIPALKAHMLEAFKYTDLPYQTLEERAGRKLIHITFNLEPISDLPRYGDLKARLLTYPVAAVEFPLMVNILKLDGGLQIEMDFQNQIFTSEAAEEFLNDYVSELKSL